MKPKNIYRVHLPKTGGWLAITGLVALLMAGWLPYRPATAGILGKDCSRTSVGLIPLTDMAPDENYYGEEGGLYGVGVDELPELNPHMLAAYQATLRIQPRGPSGVPDQASGKIGFISIGVSNTSQEFGKFMEEAAAEQAPNMVLVNGAQPGMGASYWADPQPGEDPWTVLAQRIQEAGLTAAQVQAVWLKSANVAPQPGPDDFPVYATKLRDDMAVIVKRVKVDYPNVQIIYFSSRIYAGYSTDPLSPEPFAYEGAFSVRWLIQDQVAGGGDTGVTYDNAPVLLWGPYLWADGTNPRSDGLTWLCDDFKPEDGVHPSGAGETKVAQHLLNFLINDTLARSWFTGSGQPPVPDGYDEFIFLPLAVKP